MPSAEGITGIVAALVATVTVGAAAISSFRKDKFEMDRILRADEEMYERTRYYPPPPPMNYYQPIQGFRQLDVNWVDTGYRPPMYCDSPMYCNSMYPNPEVSFDNGDSTIRAIANRPPMPSPIFGYGYHR